jgi:hypothetical protein
MKKTWIYDLEVFKEIFTATFIDKDSDETRVFVITKDRDDRKEFFNFLANEVIALIGYNSLHYDSQIIEYFLKNRNSTTQQLRDYSDLIILSENRRPDYPEWKLTIPQLDLFKINHFDNKNRRTSLKWCEYGMDLENIEEIPDTLDLESVLYYNLNDVIATKKLYYLSKPLIETRKSLTKKYQLNMMNYSNTKIGSELLLHLYCLKTNKDKNLVKQLRTPRDIMYGKDIVFDYINFESYEFNQILKYFKNQIITSTKKSKDEDELNIKYKNFEYVYGKGGIHGSLTNVCITSDEENIIIDADVSSLYPNIAIANELFPEHLGKEFFEVYNDDIVKVRIAEKKKKELGDKAVVDGFKESANATYGNSNQEHSWLYDPLYTMRTTINGQLIITMLCERLVNEIPKLQMIQANTDGITVKFNKKYIDLYYQICNEWMILTKWELEYAEYSKMVIENVNNYLAVYTNGKTKCKGRFEFENIPLHKNKSYSIIPRAIYNYFVKNIAIEDTIRNHKNIYDFCAGVKASSSPEKGKSKFVLYQVIDGKLERKKLSKIVRYFVSKRGGYLIKEYADNTTAQVEAPIMKGNKLIKEWKVTYFNNYYELPIEEYNIDYSYYISKAREIINNIEDIQQLKLL